MNYFTLYCIMVNQGNKKGGNKGQGKGRPRQLFTK